VDDHAGVGGASAGAESAERAGAVSGVAGRRDANDPRRGARLNPMKIAQLKWYLSNTSTQFPVGSQPYGLCFDGANIWSANFGDNTVGKIQANDGTVLGTFKVGNEPFGVTFDGANVWVSNLADATVTKLKASDGADLGTFTVGYGPGWMTFDGQNIWVPGSKGTVTKLRASDGKNQGTFTVSSNTGAIASAFDGQNVWVTDGTSAVIKVRASDGAVLGTFPVGNGPLGIAFDGADMWVANRDDGTVTELRASDGKVLGTFTAPDGPYGVAFDGTYTWLSGDLFTQVISAQGRQIGGAVEDQHNDRYRFRRGTYLDLEHQFQRAAQVLTKSVSSRGWTATNH
jgi:hypothetical protein